MVIPRSFATIHYTSRGWPELEPLNTLIALLFGLRLSGGLESRPRGPHVWFNAPRNVSARSGVRGPALFPGSRAQLFRLLHHLGIVARYRAGRARPDHGHLRHERVRKRAA